MTAIILSWTLETKLPDKKSPSAFLSPLEQEKLATLRFEKRRREWLLGRWTAKRLLLAAVPEFAGLDPRALTIENEPSGAPRVLAPTGTPWPGCISISHREDRAFCALCFDPAMRIGADLEAIEPRTDAFVRDYLTALEAAQALALPPAERERRVMLCWSAKEAVLKALRIGLRADTRSIELLDTVSPAENGWGELLLRSSLPGLEGLRGWYRQEGSFILTLAALGGPAYPVDIRPAPQSPPPAAP